MLQEWWIFVSYRRCILLRTSSCSTLTAYLTRRGMWSSVSRRAQARICWPSQAPIRALTPAATLSCRTWAHTLDMPSERTSRSVLFLAVLPWPDYEWLPVFEAATSWDCSSCLVVPRPSCVTTPGCQQHIIVTQRCCDLPHVLAGCGHEVYRP